MPTGCTRSASSALPFQRSGRNNCDRGVRGEGDYLYLEAWLSTRLSGGNDVWIVVPAVHDCLAGGPDTDTARVGASGKDERNVQHRQVGARSAGNRLHDAGSPAWSLVSPPDRCDARARERARCSGIELFRRCVCADDPRLIRSRPGRMSRPSPPPLACRKRRQPRSARPDS
jgi:hypothetical protein